MSKQYLESEERALADRLVNYSDAIVALSFISSSGFGLAVADPDVRETLVEAAWPLLYANIALGVVFSMLLMVLRRWEQNLRSESRLSAMGVRYTRNLYIARHIVIWVAVGQTVAMVVALIG
ncbi:MAG: hypothetical protein AB8B48_14180 [Pseudomonadales bacterium]